MDRIVARWIVHAVDQVLGIPARSILRCRGTEVGKQIERLVPWHRFEQTGISQFRTARPPTPDPYPSLQREKGLELEQAFIERRRFLIRQCEDQPDIPCLAQALNLPIDAADQLRRAILLQNEEIDELDRCGWLAVQIDLLMKEGDLTDFFTVVVGGNDRAALTEAAFVKPFYPLRGKNHRFRSERLGRNAGRDFVIDSLLFRNRNHQAGLPRR